MAKSSRATTYLNSYRRVLIARFSALGDVAMTIPVLYSVCRVNPDTHFVMLTTKFAAQLFVNAPANLEVKGIDKQQYQGIRGLRRLYCQLRDEVNPEVFIDLHGVLRTHILALQFMLNGIKVRQIDKGRAGKRALTRNRNKRLLPLISSRARYREVFERAGFKFKYDFRSIYPDGGADSTDFADILAPHADGEIWIGIAPFAKHRGKVYPLDKMHTVVNALASRPGYKLFLFGSGDYEASILAEWADGHDNIVSMAAVKAGLAKELALLSHCNLMVSMDSANMHLASLVELTVVSIWGATHPYCGFLGFGQSEDNAVQLNLTCRPCSVFGNKPCHTHDYFCLTGITPERIVSTVDRALNAQKKP
ncbi:MAG: glycosyltransferase family 9 protein [Muribaculaceae bacterium]|nr:glycosyltransferase family 9 protein [Muribaculaceae bacterium]